MSKMVGIGTVTCPAELPLDPQPLAELDGMVAGRHIGSMPPACSVPARIRASASNHLLAVDLDFLVGDDVGRIGAFSSSVP